MKLEQFLGIWQISTKGGSIPCNYLYLCREIEKIAPDTVGFVIVNQLQAEGYIKTLPDGRRILTDLGMQKRIPLPQGNIIEAESSESNWRNFRILCSYYADCVTQSEKQQEYLFASDLNNRWFLPTLPIGWMHNCCFSVNTNKATAPAVNRLKCRQEDEEDVYIGYPLEAFRCSNGKIGFSPIMLFPLDLGFDHNELSITIRHDEIDVNRTWLEFNSPSDPEARRTILQNFCFAEGEKTGLLNAELAVQYLNNRFANNKKLRQKLNPDYLDYSIPSNQLGIFNQAAMFVGNPLKYSKMLKKELLDISRQSPSILDKTALAYVFRDPPLKNQYEKPSHLLPLDFLEFPSNKEQNDAIKDSLNVPVSRITGPPGTGKSQVAVNLIANLVFYGKSALFSSKNHKAIHAISSRANGVLPDLSLIQFCTTPDDGGIGAEWHRQPLESIVGTCERLKRENDVPANIIEQFDDTLLDWQDWAKDMESVDEARQNRQLLSAMREEVLNKIPAEILSDDKTLCSEKGRHQIETLLAKIIAGDPRMTFWGRIISLILRRHSKAMKAEEDLRALLPDIAQRSKSKETFCKRVESLVADIADFLEVEKQIQAHKGDKLELDHDGMQRLVGGIVLRRDNLKSVFLHKRIKRVLEVPEAVRDKLQSSAKKVKRASLDFMRHILPEDHNEQARNAFNQFIQFYPAWAPTLLSLNKASPCIPGLFDRVIIDEASQCELPPIIPALYRAKSVTVLGDLEQFPPVITMRETRHAYIRYTKHKLININEKFDFITGNAFAVMPANPIMLREHFRCDPAIADYFNRTYYNDKLKVRTDTKRLKFPSNMGFRSAVEWINVHNSREMEISKVKELLQQLESNGYSGSVGVISPFRQMAERLKVALTGNNIVDVSKDIGTANSFQGGERDLMIFVLGLTSEISRGERWYAVGEENKYGSSAESMGYLSV